MELLIAKFNTIVGALKKKTYDFLDQRRTDFDTDYAEFKNAISDLHTSLVHFMDTQFNKITNTQRALALINRFDKLHLPNITMHDKYTRLLAQFARDIDFVSRVYQKCRLEPPIARDLPPTAGKILWSRQLFRRLEQPMAVFEANRTILQYPEAKQIIKNYNRISSVLIEYELLYHRAWVRQVEIVLSGLHASLIIKDLETNEFLINFDPEIMVLIRETECMKRLKLDVPREAEELVIRQEIHKRNYQKIKSILDENKRLRASIPASFEQLILPQLARLDQTLLPGQTHLTWNSPSIDEYHERCVRSLEGVDLTLTRCRDLMEFRIEGVFGEMMRTQLCELSEEEPMSIFEFVRRTEELCAKGSEALQVRSKNIEEAVEELIELVYPEYNEELVEQVDEEASKEEAENEG